MTRRLISDVFFTVAALTAASVFAFTKGAPSVTLQRGAFTRLEGVLRGVPMDRDKDPSGPGFLFEGEPGRFRSMEPDKELLSLE